MSNDASKVLATDDFDDKYRIQDDLFRHVNGAWLDRTEIPADKATWGSFAQLREDAQDAVREIITGLGTDHPEGSVERKIADLYGSFMAEDRVEQLGAEPLREPLAEVDAIASVDDLIAFTGRAGRRGWGNGLYEVGVDADPADPTRYVTFVAQSGIGLPDEAYYREDQHEPIRTAYLSHIERLLSLAGIQTAAAQAQAVLELETQIASFHWDAVRCRDMVQMNNPDTVGGLAAAAPDLHVHTYAAATGLPGGDDLAILKMQPSFLEKVGSLLTQDRLPQWQSWARWRVVSSLAMLLSKEFVAERFAFLGTTLAGTPQLKERWRRGVELVEGLLGEAVGKLYVEKHFPASAKERMDALVANLLAAYQESISTLDWMTDETRAQALDKLAKFDPKIGYPKRWRDYSALEIDADDLVGNVRRAHEFEADYQFGKLGKPMDRDEWGMTPQTVNAYYHPLRNEIVFPAAILQPPFFNADADDAVNYGGIGAVIGHEIGHGFDDQGSTCDGDGRIRNWWTDADRAAFEERTKALIGQYNALRPVETPDRHVNGELTIGENIGDLGGLGIALKAYRLAQGKDGNDADSTIDGYTPIQRLFLSWASIWQEKTRPETRAQRLATDPHSPAEFRCNQIAKNIGEFYAAFDVSKGDGMWLDEDQRVTIW